MNISVYDTKQQVGAEVAKIIADLIKKKPDCVIGLATGASPLPTYKALIEMYNNGEISFKDVSTFNLDEYCQIPRSDKNSYFTFMHEQLFNHIDIKEENINFLDGNAPDDREECKRYDALIGKKGGIDLQLLGIGNNAHIGFNEPADRFSSGSYKTRLSNSTIEANKIYFQNGEMPHFALTMGVSGICKSKAIVLIATGEKKAQAVYNMIKKDITPLVPASILQRHDKTNIFLDKAAASLL